MSKSPLSARVFVVSFLVLTASIITFGSGWNTNLMWLLPDEEIPVFNPSAAETSRSSVADFSTNVPKQAMAPLVGTFNIPGDYPTLAAAITDLNTQGVGGAVTLNVIAGNPETAPSGGFVIGGTGSAVLTTTSSTNTVTIQGNGNTVTAAAAQVSGALNDGIFKFVGADWITITGFVMTENAANTTTAASTNNMTEWGVALLYVTATDGAQNVTIQNNTVDLDRTYQNTFGIYANATHSATAVTTSATATGATGGNSGLRVYGNTITDTNNGIVVVGPTATADNNDGIDIGGVLPATGNNVSNFGTTGTFSGYANVSGSVNGILARNSKNVNVSRNTIQSSNGGVMAGGLNGIQVPAFSNAPTGTFTNSFNNNSISLRSAAATGTITGINIAGTSASATSTISVNNNDFNTFGHTVAGSGAITFITQAGTHQTQSLSGNTFTNITVNTTGSVTFISNSHTLPAAGSKNVNGNLVVTAFSKTGAGGTVTFFTDNGSDPAGTVNNSNNNNFSNVSVTGATVISGLSNTNGGAPTKNVTGNTVSNIIGGTSGITGLASSFSGTSNVSGNLITNINCACALTGITTGSGTDSFSQNTVSGLASTGASTVIGIAVTGGVTKNIFRNKVYDLSGSNAGTTINGISVSGTGANQTTNIFNNLIGDLRAPAATSLTLDVIRGLSVTSSGTTSSINASFNTIYLNATSSASPFSTAGVFHTTNVTTTTATLNLRNNIIANLSVPAGAGTTAAYRRSNTILGNYGTASNNNLFYAGMPGPSNFIFADGTGFDQTLAAYKARVAPTDAASISENPSFVSTTGTNVGFLHINAAVPTQIEGGGISITGITDDYDGDTRNVSTPDIGADEFAGIGIDLTGPAIAYTALGNTTSTANRTISVTISDPSGVAGGATSPRIYIRKNVGSYVSNACVAAMGNNYTCVIDYSALSGVVVGDVINYFVVAQDTLGNVSANPGGGFAATSVNNVTSPPTTPNSYTIVAGFASSVNVGAGETYTSLTNAGGVFEALNAAVVTGNVTVNVTADLIAETGVVALNQLNEEGAGAGTYAITVKPAGAARIISGTNATGAIIRLNGSDRVTIDGSLSGGTDRSLSIINNSTATNTAAIHIISLGVNAGATNNTVKNTNLSCGADQSTSINVTYGISHGGALLGNGGADNDDNSFVNNAITKVNVGIYSSGISAANPVQNTIIANNLIGPTTFGADQIGRAGIIFNQSNAASVTGNEIRFVGVLEAQTSTGGSYDKFGITHAFNGWSETTGGDLAVSNTSITRNKIHDIVEENTFSAVGIFMAGGNGTNITSNSTHNNFIWNVRANGTSGDNGVGIGIASGRGDTVTFNSIYMSGDMDPLLSIAPTTSSFGLQIPNTNVVNLNLKNNVAFVDLSSSSTPALINGAIKIPASYVWGTGGSNFNDFYFPSANIQMILGRVGAVDSATLAAYQTASGQEASSVSVEPLFVSASDLHLQLASPVRGLATPISGITADIDGDLRHPLTPDVGADEAAAFVSPTVQFSSAAYSGAEGTNVTVTVTRTGNTTASSTVGYSSSNGTATGGPSCAAGIDYVSVNAVLSYAVNETSKSFDVTLCSDSVLKGNETVNLAMATPSGATLGTPATSVLTISNVLPPSPGTLQFSSANYSIGESGGTVTLTVTRTGGSSGAVSAGYTFGGGTAVGGGTCTAGVDYINTAGTVNFANGDAVNKTFSVTVCDDALFEGSETFATTLGNATGGVAIGTPNPATVTITEGKTQPTVQFSSATYSTLETLGEYVPDGLPGTPITVTLSGASQADVTVSYATTAGTATGGASCSAGVDYISASGTLTFTSGQTSRSFFITVCPDSFFEGNETVNMALSNPIGATLGTPSSAVLTIIENDPQPATVQFSSALYREDESQTAIVTVTRSGNLAVPASVDYATSPGADGPVGGAACIYGIDYIGASGTLTFNAAETSRTISIPLCGDVIRENLEAVNVTLTNAGFGTVIGASSIASVTITDTAAQYINGGNIAIQAFGPASPYPSTIDVAGSASPISSMRVTLYDVTHPNSDRIDALLIGPGGQNILLMGDAGGTTGFDTAATVTFQDAGGIRLPNTGAIASGTYEPTTWMAGQSNFPIPAPAGPYNEPGSVVGGSVTLASVFGGTNPNGQWKLFVRDDANTFQELGGTIGTIAGGWGLEFYAPAGSAATISGRVISASGKFRRGVIVTVSGGDLMQPRSVLTPSFGYYSFPNLTIGQSYTVSVASKPVFISAIRQVSLNSNVTNVDFIAEPAP